MLRPCPSCTYRSDTCEAGQVGTCSVHSHHAVAFLSIWSLSNDQAWPAPASVVGYACLCNKASEVCRSSFDRAAQQFHYTVFNSTQRRAQCPIARTTQWRPVRHRHTCSNSHNVDRQTQLPVLPPARASDVLRRWPTPDNVVEAMEKLANDAFKRTHHAASCICGSNPTDGGGQLPSGFNVIATAVACSRK